MKVKELITKLKKMDQDNDVILAVTTEHTPKKPKFGEKYYVVGGLDIVSKNGKCVQLAESFYYNYDGMD